MTNYKDEAKQSYNQSSSSLAESPLMYEFFYDDDDDERERGVSFNTARMKATVEKDTTILIKSNNYNSRKQI